MFKPKYRTLITSKCFPKDGVIGLGNQLVSIIHSIQNDLPPHIWYAADIEAVGKNTVIQNLNSIQINLIGTDLQLIEYCSGIEQFIWGVFLCIDQRFSSQDVKGIELETEDPSFRPIDCDGVLIEIRAFDTTYFGIYSDSFELITKISKIYDSHIENK